MARDDPYNVLMKGEGGGGKSGGSSSHTPQEAPNTLRSKAVVKLLELISEGPIKGFPFDNAAKGILLNAGSPDSTPMMAADGSWNFHGAAVDYRLGTPSQTPIIGFTEQSTPTTVNVQVNNGGDPVANAVVRRVSDLNADAVKVVIQLASLWKVDVSTGDQRGMQIQYAIDLKPQADAGGSYTTKVNERLNDKTVSPWQKEYRIDLSGTTGPWDIRVRRITVDDPDTTTNSDMFWSLYETITSYNIGYSNSAIVGLQADTSEFGTSIPARGFHVQGMIVQIPSNYNAVTRAYTGIWSGTFTTDYTNNPAWVLYDLLNNNRYGLGDVFTAARLSLGKWDLYSIAKYCDGYNARFNQKNLISYSQKFDNAAWTKSEATVQANAALAPDDSNTADKLVASANALRHAIYEAVAGDSAPNNTQVAISVYAKPAGRNFVTLGLTNTAGLWSVVEFNLSTGVVVGSYQAGALPTGTGYMQKLPDGWYRCVAILPAAVNPAGACPYPVIMVSNGGDPIAENVAGNNVNGIMIWGAQLETGNTATDYQMTEADVVYTDDYNATTGKHGVPDGSGGFQPRFTFNGLIRDRTSGYEAIAAILGMFRSAMLWANGQLRFMQDAPQSPVKVFTPANVVGGMFNYIGTALRARHTAVRVTWFNPAMDFLPDDVLVEDPDGIERYGYNLKEETAFGCTNFGQAIRHARNILETEKLETDTVQFKIGHGEADIMPGQTFKVEDPAMTQAQWGGRLRGDILGPEINADPGFSNIGYWTVGVGWSVAGGKAVGAGATSYVYRPGAGAIIPNRTYRYSFDIVTRTAGSVRAYVGATPTFGTAQSAVGTYTGIITTGPTGAGEFGLNSTDGFTGTVDNFSLKEIAATGAELVVNGDFAVNLNNWTVVNPGAADDSWVRTAGGTGKLSRGATAANSMYVYQAVPVVAGHTYRVKVDFSGLFNSTSGFIQLSSIGPANQETGFIVSNGNGHFETTVTPTANTMYLTLQCFSATNDFAEFDNISVQEMTPISGVELVQDGDGCSDVDAWTYNGNYLGGAGPGTITATGDYLRVSNVNAVGAASFGQSFATVPGRRYRLRVTKTSTANGIVMIGSAQDFAGGLYNILNSSTLPAWTTLDVNFTATTATTYVTLGTNDGTANAFTDFDSVSIQEQVFPGANAVMLDRPVALNANEAYTITTVMPDGTLVDRPISTAPGSTQQIDFAQALPDIPVVNALWVISSNARQSRQFRLILIAEDEGASYKMIGVEYQPSKYPAIDFNTKAVVSPFSDLPSVTTVVAPLNLKLQYFTIEDGTGAHGVLELGWSPSTDYYLRGYRVFYQQGADPWVRMPEQQETNFRLIDPKKGIVRFSVQAVNKFGQMSQPQTTDIDLSTGNGTGSSVVQPISNVFVQGTAGLTWTGTDLPIQWNAQALWGLATSGTGEGLDPNFQTFRVKLINATTLAVIATYLTRFNRFTVPYQDMVAGGLARTYKVSIEYGAKDGSFSTPVTQTFTNPAPAAPTATITPSTDSIFIKFDPPTDPDFEGTIVWMSTTAGFTPGAGNRVWKGKGNPVLPANPSTTYYIRYSHYDSFSENGLNIATEVNTTTLPLNPTLSGPPAATIEYDSAGTTFISGPVLNYVVTSQGGGAVSSGVTMTYVVLSGSFNGFNSTSGAQTVSMDSGTGSITPTSLATDTATIRVTAVLNGVTLPPFNTVLTKHRAAATTGGGGAGATDSPTQTSGFTAINTSTFTVISNVLTITPGTGKTSLRVVVDLSDAYPETNLPRDTWDVEFKVQRLISAVWTDQGTVQHSNPDAYVDRYSLGDGGPPFFNESVEGTMQYTLDIGSLTSGTQYSIRLLARVATGGLSTNGNNMGFGGQFTLSIP